MYLYMTTINSFRMRNVFSALDPDVASHDHKKHHVAGREPSVVFFRSYQMIIAVGEIAVKTPHRNR